MNSRALVFLSLLLIRWNVSAAIVGTNPPALPLTAARISALPRKEQHAWMAYVKISDRQLRADQNFFRKELRHYHILTPSIPPEGRGVRGIPLDKLGDWYAQPEALRIADILVSFQRRQEVGAKIST
jgi:hypothetical protein